MRKILLLLVIAGITLSANAQVSFTYSLGINWGYGSASNDWQNGYYYNKSGKKISGLLKNYLPAAGLFGVSGDDFSFKTDSNAKKQTIKTTYFKSFVINYRNGLRDSFIVSTSPLLTKAPIIRLLVDNDIKIFGLLYTYSNQYSSGSKETYYYGADANNLTEINSLNFNLVVKKIMRDNDRIISGLNNQEYSVDKFGKLIDFYTLTADDHVSWHKGHYYDTTANIVTGFFAKNIVNGFVAGSESRKLLFRKTLTSESIKLDAENIRCFLVTDSVKTDSFVVSHNPAFINTPFLKVITDQPVKLYNISMVLYKGKMQSKYYFGKTPDEFTELDKKNFITAMSDALADIPALVGRIKKKTVKYSDRDMIFTYLKTGLWPAPTATSY